MLEWEIWQPNSWHLPEDAQCIVCLEREAVGIFGDGMSRGCADGGNMCRRVESRALGVWELLILLPTPPAAFPYWDCTSPHSIGTPEWEILLLGPLLTLCHPSPPAPSCCPAGRGIGV